MLRNVYGKFVGRPDCSAMMLSGEAMGSGREVNAPKVFSVCAFAVQWVSVAVELCSFPVSMTAAWTVWKKSEHYKAKGLRT